MNIEQIKLKKENIVTPHQASSFTFPIS